MKKRFITNFRGIMFPLLALVAMTGRAQVNPTSALVGSWSGKLNAGMVSLTLVLNLEQADGYVVVTLDSPDQGAKGISAFKEYLSDDSIAIKIEDGGHILYKQKRLNLFGFHHHLYLLLHYYFLLNSLRFLHQLRHYLHKDRISLF